MFDVSVTRDSEIVAIFPGITESVYHAGEVMVARMRGHLVAYTVVQSQRMAGF